MRLHSARLSSARLALRSLAEFIKGTVDTADKLYVLSKATNISVQTLAGFKVAAEESGATLDTVANGIAKLARAIGEGTNGNVKYQAALAAMGVTAKDPTQGFYQLADSVSKLKDPLTAGTELTTLLGRGYLQLIPTLQLGSEELKKAAIASGSFADAMGLMAPNAHEFNDNLIALKANAAGLVAGGITPLLKVMIDILSPMHERIG